MRTGSPAEDAWHEAGHALVAHVLGGRIVELTLEAEDERFEGRASVEWPPASARDSADRSARVALAGPIAELEQFGDEAPQTPHALSAWEADWEEVERCAAVVCPDPDERSSQIERWFHEVAEVVRDPDVNERIARVADALDAHGTLDETLFDDCL